MCRLFHVSILARCTFFVKYHGTKNTAHKTYLKHKKEAQITNPCFKKIFQTALYCNNRAVKPRRLVAHRSTTNPMILPMRVQRIGRASATAKRPSRVSGVHPWTQKRVLIKSIITSLKNHFIYTTFLQIMQDSPCFFAFAQGMYSYGNSRTKHNSYTKHPQKTTTLVVVLHFSSPI